MHYNIARDENMDIGFLPGDDAILSEYSAVVEGGGRAMRAIERERRRIGLTRELGELT